MQIAYEAAEGEKSSSGAGAGAVLMGFLERLWVGLTEQMRKL